MLQAESELTRQFKKVSLLLSATVKFTHGSLHLLCVFTVGIVDRKAFLRFLVIMVHGFYALFGKRRHSHIVPLQKLRKVSDNGMHFPRGAEGNFRR